MALVWLWLQSLTRDPANAWAPPAGLARSVRSQAVPNDVNVSWRVVIVILTKQQQINFAVQMQELKGAESNF